MVEISKFGYYWLDTWILANVIQLATQDFCIRYLNVTNDPCGRQYDQMTQAARSVPATAIIPDLSSSVSPNSSWTNGCNRVFPLKPLCALKELHAFRPYTVHGFI